MGWKDWPSWLKGILWAICIYILIFFLSWIVNKVNGCNFESAYFIICSNVLLHLPLIIPLLILGNGSFLESLLESGGIYSFITQLVPYIIIGALIGWIVGIIKSKKQEQVN